MQKLFEKKLWVIGIAVLTLMALVGLASGLENISFHSAQPFIRSSPEQGGFNADEFLSGWREIPVWAQAGVWLAIFFLAILIGVLLSPENRRLLLRTIFRVAVTYWLLYFLFTKYGDELSITALDFISPVTSESANASTATPPVFTPTASMVWASYVVSFLIVLIAVFISWRMYRFWIRLHEDDEKSSIKEIANIARASLRDLTTGRDSTDAILNCYYRMSDVVADKRDMQRKDSMTASEFAIKLEQAGLPSDAVRRLTRLFEAVRYGGRKSEQRDVNEAIACLNIILNYCGEMV